MFVRDRMATNLITASPETTIFEAGEIMREKQIRHLPVVDSDGKLLGIVSDRDMRSAMPSVLLEAYDFESCKGKIEKCAVSEIMTENPLKIYPHYTLQDSLLVIQKKKVGALPVVDENGVLKGILSTRDLLQAFVGVLNIEEPGTLLCVVVEDKIGQLKKIVDVVAEENISLGSVLVARDWEEERRAVFLYLLTNNVANVKRKLLGLGFDFIDPLSR